MNDARKLEVAFVAALAAVLLAAAALGVAYSVSHSGVAKYVSALEGARDYERLRAQQMQQGFQTFQQEAHNVKADAARLIDNLVYAIEHDGDEAADPTRPKLKAAIRDAQDRIAEWVQ